ncbi:MAG: SDR family NAD(P)-dependent oxidoreductase, partial [Cyclobacteriaceae bacterium]|nr:SDR family NAD(P)-dependent oxidoreductase [Cyclobacteriaceae bacterium]
MQDKKKFTGRSVLITGGTSGLGLELSKAFLADECKVYILGRKKPQSFRESGSSIFAGVDFSDLRSTSEVIKRLADELDNLDIIINNAGVLSPSAYTTTADGIEYTFQVNYLAHIVVNEILIRAGKLAPNAKIVSVTSPVYKYIKPDFRICGADNYSVFRAYAESKYYTLLTGKYLQKMFPGNDIVFFGFDPGTFSSGIARMQPGWFRSRGCDPG